MSPTTLDSTIEQYFNLWNAADAASRRSSLEACCAPDIHYVDPQYDARGYTDIEALAAGFGARYPGHRFRRLGSLDEHHDRARWSWEMVAPDATIVVTGVDFGVLAEDGRLREITGFYTAPRATRA